MILHFTFCTEIPCKTIKQLPMANHPLCTLVTRGDISYGLCEWSGSDSLLNLALIIIGITFSRFKENV